MGDVPLLSSAPVKTKYASRLHMDLGAAGVVVAESTEPGAPPDQPNSRKSGRRRHMRALTSDGAATQRYAPSLPLAEDALKTGRAASQGRAMNTGRSSAFSMRSATPRQKRQATDDLEDSAKPMADVLTTIVEQMMRAKEVHLQEELSAFVSSWKSSTAVDYQQDMAIIGSSITHKDNIGPFIDQFLRSKNTTIAINAASIIANVAVLGEFVPIFIRIGAHKLLMDYCRSRIPDIQLESARALGNLASNVAQRARLASEGAGDALLRAAASSNKEVRLVSANALGNLAVDTKVASHFISLQIHSKFLKIMAEFLDTDKEDMAEHARVCSNLAISDTNSMRLVDSGALPILFELAKCESVVTARYAVTAIYNMSRAQPVVPKIMNAPEALSTIVSLSYSHDVGVLKNVAALMYSMVRVNERESIRMLLEEDAATALQCLLRIDDISVRRPSVRVVQRAVKNEKFKKELVESGIVDLLRTVSLKSTNKDVSQTALATLEELQAGLPNVRNQLQLDTSAPMRRAPLSSPRDGKGGPFSNPRVPGSPVPLSPRSTARRTPQFPDISPRSKPATKLIVKKGAPGGLVISGTGPKSAR